MVSIIYNTVSTNSMIMMWSMAKLSSTDAPLSNVDHWIPAPVVEKEDIVNSSRNLISLFFKSQKYSRNLIQNN